MEKHLGKFDYYEILEVSKNAPQNEISRAYERSKNTYSSANPAIYTIFSEQEARELMKMVDEAYSVIGNKTLRTIYDQKIQDFTCSTEELSLENLMKAMKNLQTNQLKVDLKLTFVVNEDLENEIKSCEKWDGDFLRKIREYKNVSIERLHKITKINPYYLTAIEEMDISQLPATVFIRGYIVQFARALHLNDKKVPDSYMKLLKEKIK